MPEPTTVEAILRALVDAMEARECAEPDLPAWEANARLRAAEASLLRLYRAAGRPQTRLVAIDIETAQAPAEPTTVEVA
jgi:hypothetical protein